ncbi:hypothetical protein UFOVP694_55 [uncultured Caudovirales phage]|jgi:hypothetical protein|uniref:Glycosyl transferase family 25 domain-containing protein n=1 Tax=uncultured Caudovirales phage TaxID=2100421 RepID=A0A6J5NFA3_9CAUD|nr:hypothetical protein UFOVP694_55 [uncultured Caudovirales phage]
MTNSNGCFYVFHTQKKDINHPRNICAKNINEHASLFLNKLDSVTIKIVDDYGVKNFLDNNKKFLIDPKGWDPYHRTELNSYKRGKDRPLGWSYGYIGVFAGSYIAWKNFLNTDYDYLVLFENDMILNDNFFELMFNYMKLLPEDWDLFYQYSPGNPNDKKINVVENSYPICKPYQHFCNAAYVISRRGAEKAILEIESKPVFLPVDWFFLKQLDIFNIFTVVPEADMGCSMLDLKSTHQHLGFTDISHLL